MCTLLAFDCYLVHLATTKVVCKTYGQPAENSLQFTHITCWLCLTTLVLHQSTKTPQAQENITGKNLPATHPSGQSAVDLPEYYKDSKDNEICQHRQIVYSMIHTKSPRNLPPHEKQFLKNTRKSVLPWRSAELQEMEMGLRLHMFTDKKIWAGNKEEWHSLLKLCKESTEITQQYK